MSVPNSPCLGATRGQCVYDTQPHCQPGRLHARKEQLTVRVQYEHAASSSCMSWLNLVRQRPGCMRGVPTHGPGRMSPGDVTVSATQQWALEPQRVAGHPGHKTQYQTLPHHTPDPRPSDSLVHFRYGVPQPAPSTMQLRHPWATRLAALRRAISPCLTLQYCMGQTP